MPQSLASVYLHAVFSTKNRLPFVAPEIAPQLYRYLAGMDLGNETRVLDVGGVEDHVHLLLSFGREVTIADTLKALKGSSSRWVHDRFGAELPFQWQSGYGIFSVGYSDLSSVRAYIANQARHHAAETFQDELRALFTRHGTTWDERYVWD